MVTVTKTYAAFTSAPTVDSTQQPDFEQLNFEIDQNAIITTALVEPKSRPFDITVPNIGIEFASTLSGAEDTELDVIIAAHTGLGLVRGTDTHTFIFASPPSSDDDVDVPGVGGLSKYSVGDLGLIIGTPSRLFVARDLSAGAAFWDEKVDLTAVVLTNVPSLELIATNDAIAVSTSPGPIAYNSSDLDNIQGFFSYSSPTLTALKACTAMIWPRLDSTVNSGSSRSGILLDIRLNDVSQQTFSNNSDNSTDTQNNASVMLDFAINDTLKIFCNSYVTGLSDVPGGPNRMQLIVVKDLT